MTIAAFDYLDCFESALSEIEFYGTYKNLIYPGCWKLTTPLLMQLPNLFECGMQPDREKATSTVIIHAKLTIETISMIDFVETALERPLYETWKGRFFFFLLWPCILERVSRKRTADNQMQGHCVHV